MTLETDDRNTHKIRPESPRHRRELRRIIIRRTRRMRRDQSNLRWRYSRPTDGHRHRPRRAVALRMRLGEMVRIGRFTPTEYLRQHRRPARRCPFGALQDDDSVSFAQLHSLPVFTEGAKRTFGDKSQAIEAAVRILAD